MKEALQNSNTLKSYVHEGGRCKYFFKVQSEEIKQRVEYELSVINDISRNLDNRFSYIVIDDCSTDNTKELLIKKNS